jgi:hypothetical protein
VIARIRKEKNTTQSARLKKLRPPLINRYYNSTCGMPTRKVKRFKVGSGEKPSKEMLLSIHADRIRNFRDTYVSAGINLSKSEDYRIFTIFEELFPDLAVFYKNKYKPPLLRVFKELNEYDATHPKVFFVDILTSIYILLTIAPEQSNKKVVAAVEEKDDNSEEQEEEKEEEEEEEEEEEVKNKRGKTDKEEDSSEEEGRSNNSGDSLSESFKPSSSESSSDEDDKDIESEKEPVRL